MARHKKPKKASPHPQMDQRRREELLGVLLMLLGVLVLIAMATYTPGEVPATAEAGHVKNGLGIAGVYLSHYLIMGTIGFAAIFFPFLIIAWGFNRFLGKTTAELLRWTLFVSLIAFFVSISGALHGLISNNDPAQTVRYAGVMGTSAARLLRNLFGTYGSTVVLIGLIVLTVLIFTRFSFAELFQLLSAAFSRFLIELSRRTRQLWQSLSRSEPKRGYTGRPTLRDGLPTGEAVISRTDRSFAFENPSPSDAEPMPTIVPRRPVQLQFDLPQAAERPETAEREEPEFDDAPPAPEMSEAEYHALYQKPPIDLLAYEPDSSEDQDEELLRANAHLLEEKLSDFDIRARVVEIHPGPVITRYELELAPGIKVAKIVSLADDLAMAMRAKRIRIVAPIPGKAAVGVELPNAQPSMVYLKEILASPEFVNDPSPLTLAIGKTASGRPFVTDLAKMPHLLVAGSTGSGKSVCLNTIITSMLYKATPSQVQFVMIDPKRLELSTYSVLYRHHLQYVEGSKQKVATSPRTAIAMLKAVEQEMERRYETLAGAGVRNIEEYNQRIAGGRMTREGEAPPQPLPYLVLVVDELADLMMTSSASRDVEEPIARLTQMSRAVGIHLIVATQRPSVDVITGVIKANFPARIAFQVASKVDSRTILDQNGAEKLLGRGDLLFMPPASPEPVRLHNAFISLEEIEKVLDHVSHQPAYNKKPMPAYSEEQAEARNGTGDGSGRDALFWDALRIVVMTQQGSVSLLQRKLKVGYSRAARIIDELETAGIVGPFEGSKARQVLLTPEELEEMDLSPEEEL
ncbi:DNA translocase FtsK [candidate division KSB1 bacterium]|nr:DNA translocase FtsK [candidate division KSB1 bacterium]